MAVLHDAEHLRELRAELDRAVIVAPDEIPPGVITMDSTVMVIDVTERHASHITLVYPSRGQPGARPHFRAGAARHGIAGFPRRRRSRMA